MKRIYDNSKRKAASTAKKDYCKAEQEQQAFNEEETQRKLKDVQDKARQQHANKKNKGKETGTKEVIQEE